MGNFYTNYSLPGVSQQTVAAALAGRAAIVSPAANNIVVVFDEKSDAQDLDIIKALAAELSNKCHCPVLATMNHDDSVLWCTLYIQGRLADEYNSCPGYFDGSPDSFNPAGGDATQLATAFGIADPAPIEKALRAPSDVYIFAFQRHAELAAALRLPDFVIGGSYTYINSGELPPGLSETNLIRTN